jgi:3'-phosphoadenosine 5'-phosphosulfate sulfotransferase (PAPS reductase)/FAD synthetase
MSKIPQKNGNGHDKAILSEDSVSTILSCLINNNEPVIVSYGLGVDSTALLIALKQANIIPAAILFADVGNEKPGTYDYLPIISNWLKDVGFPLLL